MRQVFELWENVSMRMHCDAYMRRMCKLPTGSSQPGFEWGPSLCKVVECQPMHHRTAGQENSSNPKRGEITEKTKLLKLCLPQTDPKCCSKILICPTHNKSKITYYTYISTRDFASNEFLHVDPTLTWMVPFLLLKRHHIFTWSAVFLLPY